jgi:hypothetical protein
MLDYIKDTGFLLHSGAITISVSDMEIPEAMEGILAEAERR